MDATDLSTLLDERLSAHPAREAWEGVREKIAAKGAAVLEIHLASLPRILGREVAAAQRLSEPCPVELGSFRACDLGAARLLLEFLPGLDEEAPLLRLFNQGDQEERRMILRALPLVDPEGQRGARELLGEAHRSNDQVLFEAGLLDSEMAARLLETEDFNNAILKAAFVDLPAERFFGWEGRANPELSRILLDFMAEREAAQRSVWADSLLVAAHAPVAGVVPRVLGQLWSGVDAERCVAVRAAQVLERTASTGALGLDAVREALKERAEAETSEPVRALFS